MYPIDCRINDGSSHARTCILTSMLTHITKITIQLKHKQQQQQDEEEDDEMCVWLTFFMPLNKILSGSKSKLNGKLREKIRFIVYSWVISNAHMRPKIKMKKIMLQQEKKRRRRRRRSKKMVCSVCASNMAYIPFRLVKFKTTHKRVKIEIHWFCTMCGKISVGMSLPPSLWRSILSDGGSKRIVRVVACSFISISYSIELYSSPPLFSPV